MATKRSGKASKSSKTRSKRIPSVKKLDAVRPLKDAVGASGTCLR